MKRHIRILVASLILMVTVLSYNMDVLAASDCEHHYVTFSKNLEYREKTGEHVVTLANGLQATCYIYKEYYRVVEICDICNNSTRSSQQIYSNIHSISH